MSSHDFGGPDSGNHGSDSGDDCDSMCCFKAYLWCFGDRRGGAGKARTRQAQQCTTEELVTIPHESPIATPPPPQGGTATATAVSIEDLEHMEMITRDRTLPAMGDGNRGESVNVQGIEDGLARIMLEGESGNSEGVDYGTTPEGESENAQDSEGIASTAEEEIGNAQDSKGVASTIAEGNVQGSKGMNHWVETEGCEPRTDDVPSTTMKDRVLLGSQDEDPSTNMDSQALGPQGEAHSTILEYQGLRQRDSATVKTGGIGPENEVSTGLIAGGEGSTPDEDTKDTSTMVGAKGEISPMTILFIITTTIILILLITFQR